MAKKCKPQSIWMPSACKSGRGRSALLGQLPALAKLKQIFQGEHHRCWRLRLKPAHKAHIGLQPFKLPPQRLL